MRLASPRFANREAVVPTVNTEENVPHSLHVMSRVKGYFVAAENLNFLFLFVDFRVYVFFKFGRNPVSKGYLLTNGSLRPE